MHFYIKIYDQKKYNDGGFDYYLGKFKIGKSVFKFPMSIDSWSIKDYVTQWIQGLERIKTNNESCLVYSINSAPSVFFWVLFKENNKIFIQTRFIGTKLNAHLLKNNSFTLETCYEFIKPRFYHPDSHKALEYKISIDDIDPALEELKVYMKKIDKEL